MIVNVIMFGIAKEIFGESTLEIEFNGPGNFTAGNLKSLLETRKPQLKELGSYMIAVNNEYADDDYLFTEKDEVAIIPPVSGG